MNSVGAVNFAVFRAQLQESAQTLTQCMFETPTKAQARRRAYAAPGWSYFVGDVVLAQATPDCGYCPLIIYVNGLPSQHRQSGKSESLHKDRILVHLHLSQLFGVSADALFITAQVKPGP